MEYVSCIYRDNMKDLIVEMTFTFCFEKSFELQTMVEINWDISELVKTKRMKYVRG